MPYIKSQDREKFDFVLSHMPVLMNKGELEYCVTKLMKLFMSNRENRYSNLHDCVYGCIHAGEEYRRRYLDKREDEAIIENGDIQ
jgi:hypothetical protein